MTATSKYKIEDKFGESVSGAKWVCREVDERKSLSIIQRYNLPGVIANILAARDINIEHIGDFLNPKLKTFLPDPFHLLDMDKAAERIVLAVVNKENIAIFGDYDVDGATSSALLKRLFKTLGVDVFVYIPDRVKEGYGPNTKAMLELREKHKIDVCITVDCGTASFEPLAEAKKSGMDVIVIDHHLSTEQLPEAYAIVNPNRLDDMSEHGYMAAVGVSFLFAVAIVSKLKEVEHFKDRPTPDLLQFLDIVALGTVCDVVPLVGANRAFVSQGLKIINKRTNLGIRALCDIGLVNSLPGAYHLGFVLGPRINAGGRVGKSDLGSRILSTENEDEAYSIAKMLDNFNAERKAIEQFVLDDAINQVEQNGVDKPVLFVVGQRWHQGVIGIVASRITEKYSRPCAVISIDNGVGKASARSVIGVDFGSAVVAANQNGLLLAGGGHSMAAGFSVEEGKINNLHEFLCNKFADNKDIIGVRTVKVDGYVTVKGANLELAEMLSCLEPFGTDNYEPRFVLPNVYVIKQDVVGGNHVSCILADAMAGGTGGSIRAIAFKSLGTPVGDTLLSCRGKNINVAGKIRINHWNGNKQVQFLIDDIAMGRL